MANQTNNNINCSLIIHDLIIDNGRCLKIDDNVVTFTNDHHLPLSGGCTALVSLKQDESNVTVELKCDISPNEDLLTFNLTILKNQIGWGHFQNLVNYV
jgi:hypothetical protein